MCVQFLSLILCLFFNANFVSIYTDGLENRRTNGGLVYPDDLRLNGPRKNLMHHHHPVTDYPTFYMNHPPSERHHHTYYPNDEQEDYDSDITSREESESRSETNYNGSLRIPLDFVQELNGYTVNDLLLNFVDLDEDQDGSSEIKSRFGSDDSLERSAAITPQAADCIPELQTIKLQGSDDPSLLHVPECIRIERCGGCCKDELLSCQPLQIESVTYKINKLKYNGNKRFKKVGTELISVEKHTKCKCQCKVQPKDCTKFQEYNTTVCKCMCRNIDEMKKCAKHHHKKFWNRDLCKCQCSKITHCTTGSYFNENECRCLLLSESRKSSNVNEEVSDQTHHP